MPPSQLPLGRKQSGALPQRLEQPCLTQGLIKGIQPGVSQILERSCLLLRNWAEGWKETAHPERPCPYTALAALLTPPWGLVARSSAGCFS